MPEKPRVVSLIASSTEIVCALGMGDCLVGRSHECDYPEWVRRLPVCTEVKLATDGTSYAIDQQVKAIVAEGLSVYRVKPEVLRTLQPDIVLTQTQCEVCAVSRSDVEAALCEWTGSRPRIVDLHPDALEDVFADIERVAEALGVAERGRSLVRTLRERMARIANRARRLDRRPTVACIEWVDPLMAAGNWMPELVEMAGGRNLFGEAGRHAPDLNWEDLVAADPEVIAILPCGYSIDRAMQDVPLLRSRPEWPRLRAVRQGRVFVCDGNQYFNRPGPRLAESLEMLAEMLHPAAFRFGYEGRGWVRVPG